MNQHKRKLATNTNQLSDDQEFGESEEDDYHPSTGGAFYPRSHE
jgi:hypothetical protein